MEKFKLINAEGKAYDVMPKGYDIDGFGYSNSGNYVRMGNRYVNTLEYLEQGTPSFSIFFPEETGELDYFHFYLFLQNAPLRLHISHDNLDFYRDVRVLEVKKNWMPVEAIEAEITVAGLTPFYKIETSFSESGAVDQNGKTYKYNSEDDNFGYKYDYIYGSSIPMSVVLNSDSIEPSPTKLIIFGECINPTWRHYVDGVLVSTGKLNATIPANRKVIVDATTIPYSIKLYDLQNNFIGDLYGASDFLTDRFIYLQAGKNRISVSQDDTNDVSIGVESKVFYATV